MDMAEISTWVGFVILQHYSIKYLPNLIIRRVMGFEHYFMGLCIWKIFYFDYVHYLSLLNQESAL